MYNNSLMNRVQAHRMESIADTAMPSLAIAWSGGTQAAEADSPESQTLGATVAIDANGSSSKLLITLAVQKVTSAGVATTDSSTTIAGATYTTLGAVIDAINDVAGFHAWALHAPHNMSTDSDNFIDLTETYLRADGVATECLYRDADQFLDGDANYANYLRVGWPDVRGTGNMRVLGLSGTSTGNTNGKVTLYRDVKGGSLTKLQEWTQATTETEYIDHNIVEAITYEGPLLVGIASDNLTANDLILRVAPAEY